MINDIAFIAADTSRTRAYLTALKKNKMLPKWVLFLKNNSSKSLYGQVKKELNQVLNYDDDFFEEASFDPKFDLEEWFKKNNVSFTITKNPDINSENVLNILKKSTFNTFIYSGYGGVLLKEQILSIGKNFLHIHGGYLPDFKGSTTNYYSLIKENSIGASAIFLTQEIDSGPIFLRKKYQSPEKKEFIDHIYDSAARAKVLIETLESFKKSGKFSPLKGEFKKGNTYYVIHPVLKHIAILSKRINHNE